MRLSEFSITAIDILVTAVFLYLLVAFRDYRRRKGLPYPPGPPSLPIIGNLLDVPKQSGWIKYTGMSKKYGRVFIQTLRGVRPLTPARSGDIFCLQVFGQVVVVLNSLSAIKDLLEKRGEMHADRPTLPMLEMYAAHINRVGST
jgi:hypothetical protein